MPNSETFFTVAIDTTRASAASIPDDLAKIKGLGDIALLTAQRGLAELRRIIDSRSSAIAGEVAHRSRRELGYTGLARREGFRTAEKLIQSTTGSTSREASTLVTVGAMVHDALIASTADGRGRVARQCGCDGRCGCRRHDRRSDRAGREAARRSRFVQRRPAVLPGSPVP